MCLERVFLDGLFVGMVIDGCWIGVGGLGLIFVIGWVGILGIILLYKVYRSYNFCIVKLYLGYF